MCFGWVPWPRKKRQWRRRLLSLAALRRRQLVTNQSTENESMREGLRVAWLTGAFPSCRRFEL
ncbi:hypothetical protein NSPZN2_160045 [Nitrospira defluvii]|uniref:Uncharacterized protein n=1 Tax=Nitrospira defluvii TaxID=330214 RepID=A0ABM8RBU5_9BACT|nr:hypothetical protein NSPZN2_160045 [Nitrospira defluvii]